MNATRPPRVLFVSYLFPPTGGVGVHRVTKFVKYLPEAGWQSSVLTVSNPSVPLQDESLLRDIPAGTIIRRAKTYEPGYAIKNAVAGGKTSTGQGNILLRGIKSVARNLANTALQPDSQILWHRHALPAGLKLLKEVPHDAIIATGPPFSSLVLGAKLSQKTGLPLILDYRDEWDISNAYWENKGQGRFANWVQTRQQAFAVRQAQVLLATTPSSAAAISQFAERHGSRATSTFIYNGFDPDDYPVTQPVHQPPAGRKFRLAFIGTLWNLNSIQPVVEALLQLSQSSPELASEIEFLLAGRRTPDQEQILEKLSSTPVEVKKLPFVSHAEAIELMQSADALLMINSDFPKTQRIINAKVFEYMAARRPMLVVAPQGDVWDIVRDLPGTMLCPPADITRIAGQLAMAVERYRCGLHDDHAIWNIQSFERVHLAKRLGALLDSVTDGRLPETTDMKSRQNQGISERHGPEC